MFDIKLIKQPNESYDFDIENGDFVIDDGLETALTVSILSDRRADPSQVPQPELRRGWMPDLVTTFPGYKIGSHIWLLDSSKITQNSLNKARDYAEKALEWMIQINLVTKIIATVDIQTPSTALLKITTTSPSGSISNQSYNLWKRTVNNALN